MRSQTRTESRREDEDMDELVAALRAAIDKDERAARLAQDTDPSPWTLDYHGAFMHGIKNGKGHKLNSSGGLMESYTVRHIVRHDPARVLRRVAADREMLGDLLRDRHLVVEDCWGDPCTCGRDARVERRVRHLAEAYGVETA